MLRMKPIADARRAERYYSTSDGGYYTGGEELRREWGGQGAARLGLDGKPEFEQFRRLIHGLDPRDGTQLTARLIEGRIPAWDVTASVPKGVTTAIERGDERVRAALWRANREAMADLEAYAATRVRKGGAHADRATGNLVWYSDEHAETRPVWDPALPEGHPHQLVPDWDRHIHNVVFNVAFDATEDQWKAVKFRPIMDQRKYFDRRFDSRLASLLVGLGYRIEATTRPNERGGPRYHSWDIAGFPPGVIADHSRRSAEIDELERSILAGVERRAGESPARLSATSKDRLGATSRRQKRDDLSLADCRAIWEERLTGEDRRGVAETIERAVRGLDPKPEPQAGRAAAFALAHHFEQLSVVPFEQLAITALERSLGAATPDEVEAELVRQGAIVRVVDGRRMATTEAVQAEERRIVGFVAGGRGTVCPVGLDPSLARGRLNDGQWRAVCGLLASPNRVNLVEGPAGAGKSSLLSAYDRGVRVAGGRILYLATTTDAAEVLKRDGFEAHTLARFLLDPSLQEAARGGRVVLDEAGLCGHADAVRFFDLAGRFDLKPVLVGDPAQHGSVPRGALLRLVKGHAGLLPFRLEEILRQEDPAYREVAGQLARGETAAGFDALDRLGWVREIASDAERYTAVADDYRAAVEAGRSVIVVSPTHAEAAAVTRAIRASLRACGRLGQDEREFTRLVAVNASEAERGEAGTYRPGDVLQYHQNSKTHQKGERVAVGDPAGVPLAEAARFQLYRPEPIRLAAGDRIRFTGTVKTLDGKHRLANGAVDAVAGFTRKGDLLLANGWEVSAQAGHFRSGFVDTSFAAQGKTTQRAILAVAAASLGAVNQEQLYVSSTRAKQKTTLYTDDKAAVREAACRSSQKLVALDLAPRKADPAARPGRRKAGLRRKRAAFLDRLREAVRHLVPEQDRQVSRGR